MTLTRREALKVMAGALAAFVLPAPRRHINLLEFCSRNELGKYDLRLPYEMGAHTYASDAGICVRVAPQSGDVIQHRGKIPPFEGLSWNHDRIRGWRELPKLEPLLAKDSDCPACDGSGYVGGVIGTDCERCDGMGREWFGADYYSTRPITCRTCKGKGHYAPCEECPACKGKAIGVFPTVVKLDGRYFDAKRYEKARALGAEYVNDNWHAMQSHPLMKFAWAGGLGLLMGMSAVVEGRLV